MFVPEKSNVHPSEEWYYHIPPFLPVFCVDTNLALMRIYHATMMVLMLYDFCRFLTFLVKILAEISNIARYFPQQCESYVPYFFTLGLHGQSVQMYTTQGLLLTKPRSYRV